MASKKNTVVQENCAACLEKCNTVLECGHYMHMKCLAQIMICECPVCRRPLTKIADCIKTRIQRNWNNYQKELDEECHNDLMNEYGNEPTVNVRLVSIDLNISEYAFLDGVTSSSFFPNDVKYYLEDNFLTCVFIKKKIVHRENHEENHLMEKLNILVERIKNVIINSPIDEYDKYSYITLMNGVYQKCC